MHWVIICSGFNIMKNRVKARNHNNYLFDLANFKVISRPVDMALNAHSICKITFHVNATFDIAM